MEQLTRQLVAGRTTLPMIRSRRPATCVKFRFMGSVLLCALPALAMEVTTGDRLRLSLSAEGAVTGVVSGNSRFTPKGAPRPMFFVRNPGTEAWTPIVAHVSDDANLHGEAKDLGLAVNATFRPQGDRIAIDGAVTDLRGEERSVDLMCALPGHAPRVGWGMDIEQRVNPHASEGPPEIASAAGEYTLWIDAFDLDPGMASISIVGANERERVLAVLAAPDTETEVDQKWRTFVVQGVREADFIGDRLRVRIANFPGGYTLLDIGAIYLMARTTPATSDGEASEQIRKTPEQVSKRSLGSWLSEPDYKRPQKERQWFFERTSARIADAGWIEFILTRGKHAAGGAGDMDAGEMPPVPNEDGFLQGAGYPWATVTQPGASGYTLAVSPDMPCQYKFQYDTNHDEMQLVLAYGLSTHPMRKKFKSRAPFHLVLFRTDDQWGFREATQRYHALSPDLFKRPTDRFGFWYGAGPYKNYAGLDGLYAYLEVHEAILYPRRFIKDRATWAEWKERIREYYPNHAELGIPVLPYRHFYHCSLHVKGDMDGTLPHMPETYDEAMRMLRTLPIPFGNGYAHHIAKVIESSAMRRQNGRYDVRLSADDPCAPTGRLIYRTSISPYLYEDRPEVMTNARSEMEFARELLTEFPKIGGIYYDAGAGGGGATYSPEHLRYAHSPLAPGPSIRRMAGKYEFGRWMGEFLHQHGKIHFVNGGASKTAAQVWHILPFDAIGVEWPPVIGGESLLRFLRTMAGHKPVSFLKIQVSGDMDQAIPAYIAKLGFYGIFPPSGVMLVGTRKRGASMAERLAPYAKVFQQMYLAGWQPVTHARSSNPKLLVERYGPGEGLRLRSGSARTAYLAIYNPTLADAKTHLTIVGAAFGIPTPQDATLLFSDKTKLMLQTDEAGVYSTEVSIPSRRLVVARIGNGKGEAPPALMDFYPAKHREWANRKEEPKLVAHWSFDDGTGQTAKDTSGNGAHAMLGQERETDAADPAWVAQGHEGGALRFDGVDDRLIFRSRGRLRIRNAFTIEAWIKHERRTPYARVIDFSPTCLYFESNGDKAGLRIGGYSVNTAWSTPIPMNQWIHLKASYDGETIRMFVDGKLCEKRAFETDFPLSGRPLMIGNAISLERPFAGLIDELKIWNYAR